MNHTHTSYGKRMEGFVIGLLVGGLTGAGAMLLLAPQSGEKTRAQIQQKSGAVRDQMGKAVEDALVRARGTARQINTNGHMPQRRQIGEDVYAKRASNQAEISE